MAVVAFLNLSSRFWYPGLHGVVVYALWWNPGQRLKLPLPYATQLLKVTKIVLRSCRCDDGYNPNVCPTVTVDPAFPILCIGIVPDSRKTLRPDVSRRFVLRKQPDLVAPGKALKRAANWIADSVAQQFRPLQHFSGARIVYLDVPAEQCPHRRRNRCPNSIARNTLRNGVHIVHSIANSPSVVASHSPSGNPRHKSAHDVCRMIMHQGHRCHHVELSQQEIPASDHWSSCETTNLSDCSEPQVDLPRSFHLIEKASNPTRHPPEVLPAPFKLHKHPRPAGFLQVAVSKVPLQPLRINTSVCRAGAPDTAQRPLSTNGFVANVFAICNPVLDELSCLQART
jgi:hypothetical protein